MKKRTILLMFLSLGFLPLACNSNGPSGPAPVTVFVLVTPTDTVTPTPTATFTSTPCTSCSSTGKFGNYPPAFTEFVSIGPGDMWLERAAVTQSGTAQNIAFGLSGQGLPATIQVGIYNDNGTGYGPATLLGKSEPQSISSGNAASGINVPNICLSPGVYWLAIGVPSDGVSIGLFGDTTNAGGEIYYYNYYYFPDVYPGSKVGNGITPLTVTVTYCY